MLRAGRTWFGSDKITQEVELAVGYNGFNGVIDLGTEKNEVNSNYQYENDGIDRNFVQDVSKGNVLSLGLGYARAGFSDRLVYTTEDVGFGEQSIDLSNPDLKARWAELVFNLRGKIVAQLYMGMTLRWKFSRKVSGEGLLKTYDIPGFGNTSRQNATSFDYYLLWRIPFSKKK